MTETPNPNIVDADTLTGEMRPIRRVVLALGSNLGDRMSCLQGAVSAIAQSVQRSLRVLSAHSEPWIWDLLADLVVGRRRSEFDRLVLSTAQALSTIDDGRGDPPVRATGRLPEGSVDALVAYLQSLK